MKRRASTVTVAEEVWAPVKATISELKEQVHIADLSMCHESLLFFDHHYPHIEKNHIYNLEWQAIPSVGTARLIRFLLATRSSGSFHISFKLSPVHSFMSSNHCFASLTRDLFTSTLLCKMVFASVPFAITTCPNHLNFLFITISCSMS